jgi:tetratricopeptide (TPR) repeat protein
VTIQASSGAAFSASGVTDKKGTWETVLPDFDRIYRLKVEKPGFSSREENLDLPAQGLKPSQKAEVTVPLPPRTEIEVYNEGVRALQAHDVPTALARFEEASAMKPDFREPLRAISGIRVMQKEYDAALAAADKLLALDPADTAAMRDRYESLAALGRKDEAVAALDQLAAKDKSPDAAKLLYNAGADAWNTKDAATARKRFAEALAADPKLHQAHTAMAEIWISEKKWDDAVAELDQTLAIAPRNFKAYERKIEVLKAAGKAAEAAEAEKSLAALRATPAG